MHGTIGTETDTLHHRPLKFELRASFKKLFEVIESTQGDRHSAGVGSILLNATWSLCLRISLRSLRSLRDHLA